MGGKLMGTERVSKEVYESIKADVVGALEASKCFKFVRIPLQNPEKLDFGDLDVLVDAEGRSKFDPSKDPVTKAEKVFNDATLKSFVYRKFQVDLISVPADKLECSLFIYAFNDFNMLLGHSITRFNVKMTSNGFALRSGPRHGLDHDLLLSTDPGKVLECLGMSTEPWYRDILNGRHEVIRTEEDIFEWFVTCRLFRTEFYKHSLEKETDRPMFQRFVQWISRDEFPKMPKEENFDEVQKQERERILKFFDKEDEYQEKLLEVQKRLEIKKKFNGAVVKEVTGLKDKELGLFMQRVKEHLGEDYLYETSAEELKAKIKSMHGTSQ
ncbi:hypothetical protein MP638_003007 [Amoeboaphelidium occidentale]|nr:hypothetical protein MP638_003007 [Amoeboaphelidium occidentale]